MKSRHAILAVLLISLCVMAVQYQPYFTSYLTTMNEEVKPYVVRRVESGSSPSASQMPQSIKIAASGWIEGRTPNVEITTRLGEQVEQILVREGDWVAQGAVLVMLDASLFRAEESVAQAEFAEVQARLKRLENGYRDSEVEAVRSDYNARVAELEGARKSLKRLSKLLEQQAASQQAYDDEFARMKSLEAVAAAAKSRLETIAAPAREDELNAARAIVEAAKAKLELSRLNLDRTRIRAPIEGRILRINAELGEVARPEDTKPLVVMSDIRQLHAVAEIDEFDALQMSVGQKAVIKIDSVKGTLAQGVVVKIEPIMSEKQLNMSRPGAKVDSLSRRVWVALKSPGDLPIGLPVDVELETNRPSYLPENAPNEEANMRSRQISARQDILER